MREDPVTTKQFAPPTVERREQLPVAGIGRRLPVNDFAGIPSLWQDFHAYDNVIPAQRGRTAYGVVSDMSASGDSYRYLAGVEVAVGAEVREPLRRITLPAGRWATFIHRGHITTIASTIRAIFGHALPAAGLVPRDNPDLLEVYRESFDPWSGVGGLELWVPICGQ